MMISLINYFGCLVVKSRAASCPPPIIPLFIELSFQICKQILIRSMKSGKIGKANQDLRNIIWIPIEINQKQSKFEGLRPF